MGGLDPVFVWLSRIGGFGLVWLGIAAVLALLWRRPGLLVAVVLADGAADLLATLLKGVFGVERPAFRYPEPRALVHVPHDGSFPSGHAATSFACAGVLAAVAPRLGPALFALAAAIALSRVYVGVHYPLDVVGGAVLGACVALVVLRVVPLRRRPLRG